MTSSENEKNEGHFVTVDQSQRYFTEIGLLNSDMKHQDIELWNHIEAPCRTGGTGFQSVRWVAAVNIGASFLLYLV